MKKTTASFIFYFFVVILLFFLFFFTDGDNSLISLNPNNSSKIKKSGASAFKENFKIGFGQLYKDAVINLSSFESDEKWNGEFEIDELHFREGFSSYSIQSKDNKPTLLSLDKNFDLSDMKIIKLFVFSERDETDESIKSFNLKLTDKTSSFVFEYSIPNNLRAGWNLIKMPTERFVFRTQGEQKGSLDDYWETVDRITLELTARPAAQIQLSLDRLWAEETQEYKNLFNTSNYDVFSLTKNRNNKTVLGVLPSSDLAFFIKNVDHAKDFSYTVKLIPQARRGSFAIGARTDPNTKHGYYLQINGIDDNGWRMYKISRSNKGSAMTQLASGMTNNLILEKNTPLWLRIKVEKETISGYLSLDGLNFIRLAEKKDSEISSGGLGMLLGDAEYLVETIDFNL